MFQAVTSEAVLSHRGMPRMNQVPEAADTAAADTARPDESFVGRWSRRKRAEPEKREVEDVRVVAAREEEQRALDAARAPAPVAPVTPPADLPAIESLTADSDYGRFMQPDVPLAARNAAMKKLFTDPHFNVMDGLDTYIDDYTKADPIPESMLRGLAQSRMLKLFNYDKEDAEDAAELARLRAERAVAEGHAADTAAAAPAPAAVQPEVEPIAAVPLPADSIPTDSIPAEHHPAVNLPAANLSAKSAA